MGERRLVSILLARHAESTWNAERRWQGQGDPSLSALGRTQAVALAAELRGRGVRAVVASDLLRAAETARIVASGLGVGLRLDPRLRERDVGTWSGLAHDEVLWLHAADVARLRAGDPELRPGGGETRLALETRVRAALAEIVTEHASGAVAVITHLGVIRVLDPQARVGNAAVWTPHGDPSHELEVT